ncbi:MAG TPA: hypothetical protein V6D31_03945 [Candidatus Sericytochromatia bacterium]
MVGFIAQRYCSSSANFKAIVGVFLNKTREHAPPFFLNRAVLQAIAP